MEQIYIPAANFIMGTNDKCQIYMRKRARPNQESGAYSLLDSNWIDKYEGPRTVCAVCGSGVCNRRI